MFSSASTSSGRGTSLPLDAIQSAPKRKEQPSEVRFVRFYCGDQAQVIDANAFECCTGDLLALFHATTLRNR